MPEPTDEIHTITDTRALVAMTNPLRRRLLDALVVDGPSTVSMLSERTDQAPGNISHHLKILSQAALIEEAPELARDRREHWWRMSSTSRRWSTATFAGDSAAEAVADAATALNLDHDLGKLRQYQAERTSYPPELVDAAFSTSTWLRLSGEELKQLSEEVVALAHRWRDRSAPSDGAERRPVYLFAHGFPVRP